MGAKSSSLLIRTPSVSILVDPGAAEMQPSYPLPHEEKARLREEALLKIKEASKRAELVFISHYHYDHHTLPHEAPELYDGKELWIKNPNMWINRSQWNRARLFLSELSTFLGRRVGMDKPSPISFEDPVSKLELALSRDYGSYRERKEELMEKGRRWLKDLFSLWRRGPWVYEGDGIFFADGRRIRKGSTDIRFTEPLFHGSEYDRVGWVLALVVEHGGKKILYTSDIQGPIIEDYAIWIISENPDLLILDGPPTYLLGYMLNMTNLTRAIENGRKILSLKSPIIYDHHPLREPLYMERLKPLYDESKRREEFFGTASEILGESPLILKIKKHYNLLG